MEPLEVLRRLLKSLGSCDHSGDVQEAVKRAAELAAITDMPNLEDGLVDMFLWDGQPGLWG